MSPASLLFYILALFALIFGGMVVFHRNPIINAIAMVGVIVSLAGIFYLLASPFLAFLQIIVYAGAIIVLFLFVIMLLDLRKEETGMSRPIQGFFAWVAGLVGFYILLVSLIHEAFPQAKDTMPPLKVLGKELFTTYVFPFEGITLLLILSMVGAFLLVRRR